MTSKARTPVAASEFRFEQGGERAVASNGELNASSKQDLLRQQQRLMAATAAGQVITEADAMQRETAAKQHAEMVKAAFNDPQVHRVLGERLADELYMTSNRKGFARRFLARNELKQGDIPRFPVRLKNVQAFIATGPTRTETQIVRDKWLMPEEVQVYSRPFIPMNELNQSNTDVLNEKYIEAMEGIMVTEDRMWYNLAKATIGDANNLTVISGNLTPITMMGVHQNVQGWGLKVAHMLMASDLWQDIIGDTTFIAAIEPVSRHELIMTGQLAVMYGMTMISEAYRHPEHKVLMQGEFVCVSDQQTHGAYSDRGGINSEPTNVSTENVIGRGWILHEDVAMAIANGRSVAFGRRI